MIQLRALTGLRGQLLALIPKRLRANRSLKRMQAQARALRAQPLTASKPPSRVFIIPSDPRTLIGARGDEAMLQAIAHTLRRQRPDLTVWILIGRHASEVPALTLGFRPVREALSFDGTVSLIRSHRPDALVVVGADMMDGFYSSTVTAMRLLAADRLSRDGVPTVVTGFSFNGTPDPALASIFDAVDSAVQLCVRDPVSMARLKAFSRARTTLVADVAFLLEPAQLSSPHAIRVANWITGRRHHGDLVLAFNLHPSLIRGQGLAGLKQLTDAAATAMAACTRMNRVSWLLLAHDFRGASSCATCLAPIESKLRAQPGLPVLRPVEEFTAAELKSIAGLVDGVVAGRMHLAIGALGMGTPIACLTYQDKFQGLLDHFQLPQELALSPLDAMDHRTLEGFLNNFIAHIEDYRRLISKHLPAITKMSEKNLDSIISADATILPSTQSLTKDGTELRVGNPADRSTASEALS